MLGTTQTVDESIVFCFGAEFHNEHEFLFVCHWTGDRFIHIISIQHIDENFFFVNNRTWTELQFRICNCQCMLCSIHCCCCSYCSSLARNKDPIWLNWVNESINRNGIDIHVGFVELWCLWWCEQKNRSIWRPVSLYKWLWRNTWA